MLALVLGGGNALGAYHGGVIEALDGAGVSPDWVAGSSIGAIMAALIAGNPRERRVAAAREFWRLGTAGDGPAGWVPERWRKPFHLTSALQARLMGRPLLFHVRMPDLLGGGQPGLYDAGPMRRALETLVDFDLLNDGPIRLSLMTVDVQTGMEVPFDTARERITADHLMASAALIPDFPPVAIGGRLLVDGGLASNVPLDLVLTEPAPDLACFAVDLLPLGAPAPRRLGDSAERQMDLAFACQTERTLRAMRQLWDRGSEGPAGAVYRLAYPYQEGEVALKSYDFSRTSLDRRWVQGKADMAAALANWRAAPPAGPGLTVHEPAAAGR